MIIPSVHRGAGAFVASEAVFISMWTQFFTNSARVLREQWCVGGVPYTR